MALTMVIKEVWLNKIDKISSLNQLNDTEMTQKAHKENLLFRTS